MKKINTALFCIFVLLFCSCDVLNKAPLDEIADDSFWSDETLVKYYVNDLYSEISVDGLQLQETEVTILSQHNGINIVQAGSNSTMIWSALPTLRMTMYGKIIT